MLSMLSIVAIVYAVFRALIEGTVLSMVYAVSIAMYRQSVSMLSMLSI